MHVVEHPGVADRRVRRRPTASCFSGSTSRNPTKKFKRPDHCQKMIVDDNIIQVFICAYFFNDSSQNRI